MDRVYTLFKYYVSLSRTLKIQLVHPEYIKLNFTTPSVTSQRAPTHVSAPLPSETFFYFWSFQTCERPNYYNSSSGLQTVG